MRSMVVGEQGDAEESPGHGRQRESRVNFGAACPLHRLSGPPTRFAGRKSAPPLSPHSPRGLREWEKFETSRPNGAVPDGRYRPEARVPGRSRYGSKAPGATVSETSCEHGSSTFCRCS